MDENFQIHMELEQRGLPNKFDDLIDSGEVINAITSLGREIQDAETVEEINDATDYLRVLSALADEASQYSEDWQYGETLIRDSYFETYAQELHEDLSGDSSHGWPYTCIDWAQAARELQQDYSAVEFDGVTYWIR